MDLPLPNIFLVSSIEVLEAKNIDKNFFGVKKASQGFRLQQINDVLNVTQETSKQLDYIGYSILTRPNNRSCFFYFLVGEVIVLVMKNFF
jgi:hypothetical protein